TSGGCMKTVLRFTADMYDDLIGHLLPVDASCEQAAFLFAVTRRGAEGTTFTIIEMAKLGGSDFDEQSENYLELSDHTRASMIKRAHDLSASLVEVHSHLGPFVAAFSMSDVLGLAETVPHMWWRLHRKPYMAMVVARSGFDALVWLEGPEKPEAVD